MLNMTSDILQAIESPIHGFKSKFLHACMTFHGKDNFFHNSRYTQMPTFNYLQVLTCE